jgi:hypothetical protein
MSDVKSNSNNYNLGDPQKNAEYAPPHNAPLRLRTKQFKKKSLDPQNTAASTAAAHMQALQMTYTHQEINKWKVISDRSDKR